ncbi:MAG: MFS transporter [Hyphomicrobium sp.]|nr:MFS transporter [Hyphomicrobium sp.]
MAIAVLPAHTSYLRPSYEHVADLDSALPRILSNPAAVHAKTATDNRTWRLVATVLLPFAAGYYLSYVFRTINALISAPLATEFGLSAADLGNLTAILFLTFGAVQLPLGSWLDRFGPRRMQAALLSIAAIGAAAFACAQDLLGLILGRALIGLGVAGALMAGLKALVLWFPAERIALANGWLITLGSLGAVTATAPAEMLIASIGWRGLFLLLAAVSAIAALLILRFVPECPARGRGEATASGITIRAVYRDARFWRLAPLSATTIGSAWALQSLWAGPWFTDVEGLPRHDVVMHLLLMAIGLSASALILGTAGDRLRRRGVSLSATFGFATGLAMLAQLALILRWPVPAWLPWIPIASIGAGTVLSYAILAEQFPKTASGRANGALNLLHIGCAFAVQVGVGYVVELWPVEASLHPPMAYQTALTINLALQMAAFLWFVRPRRRAVLFKDLPAHPIHALAATLAMPCADAVPYLQARQDWRSRQMIAYRQVSAWRSVALVAVAIMATMGATLVMSLPTSLALPQLPQSQVTSEGNASAVTSTALSEHVGTTATSPSRFDPLSRHPVCIALITVLAANGRTYLQRNLPAKAL